MELKPCPFCGGRVEDCDIVTTEHPEARHCAIMCMHCGARGPKVLIAKDMTFLERVDNAAAAWNKGGE